MKKYVVRLEPPEHRRLEQVVRVDRSAAWKIRRTNILLSVDGSDEGPKLKVREASLERKKQVRPRVERVFDGEKEAKL